MTLLKRAPDRNSHRARNSFLSRRASKKLEYVAELLAKAAEGRHAGTEKLLSKKVFIETLRFTKYLDLQYHFENRFFSVCYNLELGSKIHTGDRFREIGDCTFEVEHKGLLYVKETKWVCKIWTDANMDVQRQYLQRLNNQLITDRLMALDMHRIQVSHKEGSGSWMIRCESMVGSATWLLIPPIMNLITPRPDDCIKFIEFFELVADAVVNNQ